MPLTFSVLTILNRIYEVIHSNTLKQRPEVPRQIWSLWDKGVEKAPPMQKTCLWSHKAANPTFTVKQLDLQKAINLTDMFSMITVSSWENMSIQAKSDVIRVLLLYKYGGVWADATLCMVESLEHWLHMDVDFTTFIRHDKISTNSTIRPWMSSWFMVSRPGGVIITALKNAVINFWKDRKDPVEYFWLHRLFSNIMGSNSSDIRDAFEPRTAISADRFHCTIGMDRPKLPEDSTMFKIKGCKKELRNSIFQRIHDLYGDGGEITTNFTK